MGLKEISTKKLMEEISKREGVDRADVKPYHPYSITVKDLDADMDQNPYHSIKETGPAIILIITD